MQGLLNLAIYVLCICVCETTETFDMEGDMGGVSVEMEGGLMKQRKNGVGHGGKVGCVKKIICKKRKTCRRIRPVVSRVPKTLQELFVSCRQTFKGPGTVPSPQDVHKLCHILGTTFFLFLL